jgi:hypothetical protein
MKKRVVGVSINGYLFCKFCSDTNHHSELFLDTCHLNTCFRKTVVNKLIIKY